MSPDELMMRLEWHHGPAGLSLWITFCLYLLLWNVKLWVDNLVQSAHRLEVTLNGMSGKTDQLDGATLLNKTPLTSLLLLAPALRDAERRQLLLSMLNTAFDLVSLATMFYIVYSWRMVFHSFRRHTLMIRRGDYFFDRAAHREEFANRYIGYQVSHMTLAWFVVRGRRRHPCHALAAAYALATTLPHRHVPSPAPLCPHAMSFLSRRTIRGPNPIHSSPLNPYSTLTSGPRPLHADAPPQRRSRRSPRASRLLCHRPPR